LLLPCFTVDKDYRADSFYSVGHSARVCNGIRLADSNRRRDVAMFATFTSLHHPLPSVVSLPCQSHDARWWPFRDGPHLNYRPNPVPSAVSDSSTRPDSPIVVKRFENRTPCPDFQTNCQYKAKGVNLTILLVGGIKEDWRSGDPSGVHGRIPSRGSGPPEAEVFFVKLHIIFALKYNKQQLLSLESTS